MSVFAQAPQLLGYQGRLVKMDGTPESGNAQMRFGLFAADTGGSSLWEETQAVAIQQGYYSTYLGRMTTFPATLFDTGTLWLEVSVQAPGDTQFRTMTPRQRVGSVAFALSCRSLKGGTVDATSISVGGNTVIDANGKLTAAAGYTAGPGISIDGTTRAISVNSSGCSTGQVLQWSGSAWQCANGGSGGGISGVTGTAPITVMNGTTAPVIGVTVGTTAGTLAAGNDSRFGNATSLAGVAVSSTAPTTGQLLSFNGTSWAPTAPASGGGGVSLVVAGTGLMGGPITTTGTLSIADGGVGTLQLADNAVTTAKLVDGAVTAAKLANMGCASGQVLQYNGTAWSCLSLPSSLVPLRNAINFSDLTTEGTPISSSVSGNTWRAEWAFDKNKEANSSWFSVGTGAAVSNEWVGLDFGSGVTRVVQTVAVWNLYGTGQYGVPVYTLERSADCATWTAADAPIVGQTQQPLHWLTFAGSTTAARCWRIKAGASPFGGAVAWGVSEISMWSTVLPRPAVLSGGDLNATYPKEAAFDGLEEPAGGSGWCASQTGNAILNAAWIGYDFGSGASKSLRQIAVNNWNVPANTTHSPTAYWVERSNDCTTWTTVMRASSFSRTTERQVIDLPATAGAGRCWRLRAANQPKYDAANTTYWCAEEIEFYE
jgi:hypothetical protein